MTMEDLLAQAEEAESLARHLLTFAHRLRTQSIDGEEPRLFWPRDQMGLIGVADSLLQYRRQRSKHLGNVPLCEPAWDMLLALFKACLSGTDLTVAELCKASGSFENSGPRWIGLLIREGLVDMARPDDGTSTRCVRLTDKGAFQMTRTMMDAQIMVMRACAVVPADAAVSDI